MNLRLKAILQRDWIKAVICSVLATYIRLVHVTSRWEIRGGHIPARLWDEGRPFILAYWHGRIMMMPYCWRRGVPFRMLASNHPDGQLIARTVRHLGIDSIAGSTSRGGVGAMRAILKSLESGVYVGFTPDGPRGPRMRVKLGVIQAARLSGMPILPCAVAVKGRRVLSSWDRFIVAWPFTRGVFIWDEPITVARDASESDIEAARQLVEERLNAITAQADRLVGAEPEMPDEIPAEQPADADEGATRAMAGRP
jgi:hypothetical protein